MSEKRAPSRSLRTTPLILILILIVAALLRLVDLDGTPPGLQQDEAANAWNAWCLLNTGKDQVGVDFPIYYIRALGENRTTPHIYAIAAAQAVGGMNVWTTRLPIAIPGVLTVLLLYYVGRRLFGVHVGLAASAMLALNPWAVQSARQAVQVGWVPFIVTGVLAAMLWARLPLTDSDERPRPVLAGLGGVLAGAGCYGYFAVRLFLPLFLFGLVPINVRRWFHLVQTRRGALAAAAFVVGFAVVFGPLGWRHVTDPEMSKRGQSLWVWSESDSAITKIGKALERYPEHFSPAFLFLKGDPAPNHSIPGWGQFHWYALPLMIVGLCVIVRRARRSAASRLLLLWMILYPIGDLIPRNVDIGPHAPRSLPGLCALILLGSVGAVAGGSWILRRGRSVLIPAACALVIAVVAMNAWVWYDYFGEYRRLPVVRRVFHVDLQKACEWVRPRAGRYDAVFCTTSEMNQPYIMMLVHLRYDPGEWLAVDKEVVTAGRFDIYFRFGKFHFLYRPYSAAAIKRFTDNGRRDHVAFIVRPGQLPGVKPSFIIRGPDGKETLWVCEAEI